MNPDDKCRKCGGRLGNEDYWPNLWTHKRCFDRALEKQTARPKGRMMSGQPTCTRAFDPEDLK